MNHSLRIAAITAITIILNGCVLAIGNESWDDEDQWEKRQDKNSKYISLLELGQSMASVQSDLGDPDLNESFQRDGEEFRVIYYRTQHVNSDGLTTRDESTPLVFIDGVLVGWGNSAIENATR